MKRKMRDSKRQNADKLRKRGKGAAGKVAPKKGRAVATPSKAKGKPAAAKPKKKAQVLSDDDDEEADEAAASKSAKAASDNEDDDSVVGKRILRTRKTRSGGRGASPSLSDDDDSDAQGNKGKRGTGRAASPGSDSDSSERAYEDSESEDERRRASGPDSDDEGKVEGEPAVPLTVDIIRTCTVKRASLVKYVDEPFFKDMVLKAFVRVLYKPAQKLYSLAQVSRLVAAKLWMFASVHSSTMPMRARLRLCPPWPSPCLLR